MNYRDRLIESYSSTHASHLYGEAAIPGIERQFPVWRRYYGGLLPSDRASSIIDMGCGNGGFVHFLRRAGYENASGIDASPEQVETAKRLGIGGVERAEIMEFLMNKEGVYDAVVARDVVEHFGKGEIIELFSAVRRALKNNGVFIIQTPNAESPFGGRYRYWDFTHEVSFTASSLGQVLRAAGFADVSFRPAGPVPKGLLSGVRFALWKAVELAIRFYMLVETGSFKGIFTQSIIAAAQKPPEDKS